MKQLQNKLKTTKLTRKEFLTYVGVLTLGILGISSFLKLIAEVNPRMNSYNLKTTNPTQTSFGQGVYGI